MESQTLFVCVCVFVEGMRRDMEEREISRDKSQLPLQKVKIQISWLLKKPTDLDLHCLSLSM